ncbi:GEVED domain-containing protein [Chryseobacterium gallinarum]|uniref:GEVED domain-containing protein n=1 Tax=Chryseobacterium gallinarum TaxID=1324352 RepID=UPI0020243165|nr:GEVED domain-containing protein [Chryseobacterium gallinarum]MCL8537357.1 GEVED domain-containing protein [Chryseobacterium gallinarum]
MKKIFFLCVMFLGIGISSQILVNEGFSSITFPPVGWSTSSQNPLQRTAGSYCSVPGAATRVLAPSDFINSNRTTYLMYGSTDSNGGAINISFNYTATPTYPSPMYVVSGNLKAEYSIDGGTTWNLIGSQVNLTTTVTCTSFTGVISAGAVPVGSDFKFKITATPTKVPNVYSEFYFGLDDIQLVQTAPCLPPSALTSFGTTSDSANISWMASNTSVNYDIYYSTSNIAPSSASIPNHTNVSGTSVVLSGLNANTNYYAWVRSSCGVTDKSAWVGPVDFSTGYCVPTAGSSSSYNYLRKILTTTPNCTNLNYTASVYNAYVNNSVVAFSGAPGGSINYSLESLSQSDYYYIWVDWNNDQDFNDVGETVVAAYSYSETKDGSFIIPAGQALGSYRVRFGISQSSSNDISSCGPADNGNYVDFTLNVMLPPTCFTPIGLNVTDFTNNSVAISWSTPAVVPSEGYDIYYSTSNTAPVTSTIPNIIGISGTSANITGLAADTKYYIWVRSRCSGSDQSAWTAPITMVTGYCIPTGYGSAYYLNEITTTTQGYENLSYTAASYNLYVNNKAISFSGSPGGNINYLLKNAGGKSSYLHHIWVDWNNDLDFDDPGELMLAYAPSTGNSFTGTFTIPANQALGSYRTRFQGSYGGDSGPCGPVLDGNFVDFTLKVVAPVGSLATLETEVKDMIKIHPNPFTDTLNIPDSSKVKSVSIVDASGRVAKIIENPSSALHLEDLRQGMYLVVLNMKDGSKQTIKAIKK